MVRKIGLHMNGAPSFVLARTPWFWQLLLADW